MTNSETQMTLDEAVAEVLGVLTGLDLAYEPEQDRYQAITRAINRAMRSIALEKEWSYYSSTTSIGNTSHGDTQMYLPGSVRPRMTSDDCVRLCRTADDRTVVWAYFLPRDAIHKYRERRGLWCAVTGNMLQWSRPIYQGEAGLDVQLPVMREPIMFRLPTQPADPDEDLVEVPTSTREQLVDFIYPDLVVLKAAYLYAQTDPVMQPRVQTLEAQYKDLMYQVIERDDRHTDSPYSNEFTVPIQSDLNGTGGWHEHPHADERR